MFYKNTFLLILFTFLIFPTVIIYISVGPVHIPFSEVMKILYIGIMKSIGFKNAHSTNSNFFEYYDIVWRIRLPRVLAGLIAGACLSVAGLLLQVLFRNPIVGPWVLGVESGSMLAVGLLVLAGALAIPGGVTSPWAIFTASLAGSLCVMFLVLSIASIVRSVVTLLLIGIMIGYICSAVLSILEVLARSIQLHAFIIWSFGSLSFITWTQLKVMTYIALPCVISSMLLGKYLNAYLLGEEYAKTLGVDIRKVRIVIILLASILTSIITAFAGPIAFIGLAVPHIARLILRTSDARYLIPASALLGALLTVYCDLAARTVLSPQELPISTMTSLIGAPIVISLLMKRR